MGEKYYVVFIHRDGDVSYGCDYSCYLAQVCKTEEEAKAYIESPKCQDQIKQIEDNDKEWFSGMAQATYTEFSNNQTPEYIGGAGYVE